MNRRAGARAAVFDRNLGTASGPRRQPVTVTLVPLTVAG
jgi:hypothetical protein